MRLEAPDFDAMDDAELGHFFLDLLGERLVADFLINEGQVPVNRLSATMTDAEPIGHVFREMIDMEAVWADMPRKEVK